MFKKWKKIACISLIISFSTLGSCGVFKNRINTVMPKSNGTPQEQIQYHKKEIQKNRAQVEAEDRNAQRSLSRRDMDDVRSAQNRKMQYQKKVDQHTEKMNQLRGKNGSL